MSQDVTLHISQIKSSPVKRLSTGISSLDKVFGYTEEYNQWGIPESHLTLFSAESGFGKTRLCSLMAARIGATKKVLFILNESEIIALKRRNSHIWTDNLNILLSNTNTVKAQIELFYKEKPDIIFIDSINMVVGLETDNKLKKQIPLYQKTVQDLNNRIIFLCHNNKENKFKGTTFLPHIVDLVLDGKKEINTENLCVFNNKNRDGEKGVVKAYFRHTPESILPIEEQDSKDFVINENTLIDDFYVGPMNDDSYYVA